MMTPKAIVSYWFTYKQGTPTPTPVAAYTSEDETEVYTTEDGVDTYVPEQ